MGKRENKLRVRISGLKRNRGNNSNLVAARKKISSLYMEGIINECVTKACIIAESNQNINSENEASSLDCNASTFPDDMLQEYTANEQTINKIFDDLCDKASSTDSSTQAVSVVNSIQKSTKNNHNSLKSSQDSDVTKPSILSKAIDIDGKRMVDIQYLFDQIKILNTHAPQFGCSINNLVFTKESRKGLLSTFHMKCDMCNSEFNLETNRNDNLNSYSVQGAMSVGIGYSNMNELFSVMDVPYMNDKLYTKCHNDVCDGWQQTATKLMMEAANEEREYALSIGQIDKDGVPLVTVVADGCWSKRSYRTNYNAPSGAAAIVGQHSRKILFISIKNKFCSICSRYKTPEDTPNHICYKNFTGSSTSMEAQSIVEGFKASEDNYGIRYWKMIADGDSSTYKKILEARPYQNLTVEKVECRNHLLRNYCNKLKSLATDTRYPIKLRKLLSKNILRFRTAVVSAIAFRKQNKSTESVVLLKKDIDNSFYHIFGSHDKCDRYFCSKSTEDINYVTEIQANREFFYKLNQIVSSISNHARSLIEDVDSNVVEQFNSIIAKFVGGKRVNFSRRRSYAGRCNAAVVSCNSKKMHSDLHKHIHGTSPGKILKRYEHLKRHRLTVMSKIKKSLKNKKTPATEKYIRLKKQTDDQDYGENCSKPDLDPMVFEIEKEKFLRNLQRTDEERNDLQKCTITQAESGYWLEERRKLLTASSFHSVCTRRSTTPCGPLVKKLLYSGSLNVAATNHGKKFEKEALLQLQLQENIAIQECGLFIDKQVSFLGATPDGLVGDDLIVEVKCPYSSYKISPDEAIIAKKIKFWKYQDNELIVNKNDKWYYQIQGQLHVTGRKACIFAVWTDHKLPMKVEYILKRNDFWKQNMEQKLHNFYLNCILPELIDPRYTRNLPIREPDRSEYESNALKRRDVLEPSHAKKKIRKKLFDDDPCDAVNSV